jgi:hypothetical protein
MREMEGYIFRLGVVFGFTPFTFNNQGKIRFKWKSAQTIYFLSVLGFGYFALGFFIFVIVSTLIKYDSIYLIYANLYI